VAKHSPQTAMKLFLKQQIAKALTYHMVVKMVLAAHVKAKWNVVKSFTEITMNALLAMKML
jgi:hypothetical protein